MKKYEFGTIMNGERLKNRINLTSFRKYALQDQIPRGNQKESTTKDLPPVLFGVKTNRQGNEREHTKRSEQGPVALPGAEAAIDHQTMPSHITGGIGGKID
jgi:hypothetical protein